MAYIRKNNIRSANKAGKKGIGVSFSWPTIEGVEIIGLLGGFTHIYLDGEHGAFGPNEIDDLCRMADAQDLTVIARVPTIDSWMINYNLDRGVLGIIGPHIDTPEEAKKLADACRYTPEGHRSYGSGRGLFHGDNDLLGEENGTRIDIMSGFNEEVLVIAQLETKTAFDNLDDILSVPGIDAYTGGPNDLAQSLGLTGQPDHPDSLAVSSEIVERVHAANKKSASDLYTDTSFHSFIRDGAKSFIKSNGGNISPKRN